MSNSDARLPRGRPKAVDRQHAVEAATELYWREGLHALSVNETCRRLELSKPTLYREFGGVDGLMEAALSHYAATVLAPLATTLSEDRPFAEVLTDVVCQNTEDRGTPAGCLFAAMRASPGQLGPETSARVEALVEDMLGVYRSLYQRAVDRSEADPRIPVDLAARYLDRQLRTVLEQMGAGVDPDLIRAQAHIAFSGLMPS